MTRDFICVECGRQIVRFGMRVDEVALCAHCLSLPGWHDDPWLRAIFDREMDVPPAGNGR